MIHYNLVHKPFPMPQSMKNPDAKAAVDRVGEAKEFASMARINSLKQTRSF